MESILDRATQMFSPTAYGDLWPDDGSEDVATAAAAAEAARVAAQPLDPVRRAAEGFRIAAGVPDAHTSPVDRAIADAGANARAAMSRTDLAPELAKELRTVLERLGNAVVDGKIDPHMNGKFRQLLYSLATDHPDSTDPKSMGDFREALAHMTRAAQVLDRFELAQGTGLAFEGHAGAVRASAGLPLLDVPKLDADLYFKTRDGTLRIESSQYSAKTFADKVKAQAKDESEQLRRQSTWEAKGSAANPRAMGYYMLEKNKGFLDLMNDQNLGQLERSIGNPAVRNIVIGDRAYSLNELKALDAAGKPRADAYAKAMLDAHVAAGNPAESFDRGAAYKAFYRETMASPDAAMRAYGVAVGEAAPPLKPLAHPEVGSLRLGTAAGAAGAGVIALIQLGAKGKVDLQDVKAAAVETAQGGIVGAVSAKAEQYVIPAIERRLGASAASRVAAVAAPRLAASDVTATGIGIAERTIASRVIGSTVIGTVVTTAMSAYDNRAGLARGDPRAIGNVTADTVVGVAAVGASSIAGAAATGALAGSVVPGVGTAIGFGVGLAVGVGVAYGAQISGARDAIAAGAAKAVDWVKSWF
jgi:hypothetical protein